MGRHLNYAPIAAREETLTSRWLSSERQSTFQTYRNKLVPFRKLIPYYQIAKLPLRFERIAHKLFI
jgi:hypothetical protein